MTKEDLKMGYLVEYRTGSIYRIDLNEPFTYAELVLVG